MRQMCGKHYPLVKQKSSKNIFLKTTIACTPGIVSCLMGGFMITGFIGLHYNILWFRRPAEGLKTKIIMKIVNKEKDKELN